MIWQLKETQKAGDLFKGWEETMIWSCLEGTMGAIYTEDLKQPRSAAAILGDFCFLAGAVSESLIQFKPETHQGNFVIMVPQNKEWETEIARVYKAQARKVRRYALKKEKDIFDQTHLQSLVKDLPAGYSLHMIDEKLFNACRASKWSCDLVSQFKTYADYKRNGLGVMALSQGKIVAGASSYSAYKNGIEIEIDTETGYRRRGLATACGAQLILECIKRNWYPSWDAQNKNSLALAEKLGYHFSHEYTAFEIDCYGEVIS